MKKTNPSPKKKLGNKELRQELSDIVQELKTSTVSFTKERLLTLIERLDAEAAAKPKKSSSNVQRKRKSRQRKAKS